MGVVNHPYLDGVKCRDDGAVWIPATRNTKGHWTFGCSAHNGYLQVTISWKRLAVHRLICEAFHGLCPENKCHVDHIDRNPANNKPENLRWCTRSENQRNRSVHEESVAKYGVSQVDDRAAYQRAYYAHNPGYRERHKGRMKSRYAKKKEKV